MTNPSSLWTTVTFWILQPLLGNALLAINYPRELPQSENLALINYPPYIMGCVFFSPPGYYHLGMHTNPCGGLSICADVRLLHLCLLLLLFPATREKIKVLQGHLWSVSLATGAALPVSLTPSPSLSPSFSLPPLHTCSYHQCHLTGTSLENNVSFH